MVKVEEDGLHAAVPCERLQRPPTLHGSGALPRSWVLSLQRKTFLPPCQRLSHFTAFQRVGREPLGQALQSIGGAWLRRKRHSPYQEPRVIRIDGRPPRYVEPCPLIHQHRQGFREFHR
ncbi:MAG TPA: hypothetical protein DDX89_05195 [Candidatus Omnitrophica bacterium]|nr:hypothetical protein [Candidatus Omnitrophota bacterium]